MHWGGRGILPAHFFSKIALGGRGILPAHKKMPQPLTFNTNSPIALYFYHKMSFSD